MKPERWRQVDALLQSALERAPGERSAYLAEACANDPSLKAEVETLLASYDEAGSFIESPAPESGQPLPDAAPPALEPGCVLGSYQVSKQLGAGGMGEVYLARHTQHDRLAALKILPAHFTNDPQRLERFRREARAVLALNHPHIVTAYDIGESNGVHFIATELVEGETLRARLERSGRLELGEAVEVAAQTAAALVYAHEHGVVHRDVKPENVMLRDDGYVKVLDFGIARLAGGRAAAGSGDGPTLIKGATTSPGMVMGTVSYMSPEQARGLAVDARTDVWSLGVVLYEMLSGHVPFAGETVSDTIALILGRNPPPLSETVPGAPAELEYVVSKALEKDREDRYQTAKDMLADLRRFRKRYEQQVELERSAAPVSASDDVPAPSNGVGAQADVTAQGVAASTADARYTTSAGHVVSRMMGHRRAALIAAVLGLGVLAGAGLALYKFVGRSQPERGAPVAPLQSMKFTKIPVSGDGFESVISPDGRFIARVVYEKGKSSLRLRQVSGATEREVVPPAEVYFLEGTAFSPDGNSLYYVAGQQGKSFRNLYRVSVLGGAPQKLIDDVDTGVALSPDGKRLAFYRGVSKTREGMLIVANEDGTGEQVMFKRTLPANIRHPAWSPDGQTLAYPAFNKDDGGEYYIVEAMTLSDGSTRPVSHTRWIELDSLRWLPEGTGLFVTGKPSMAPKEENGQIWYVPFPEGEPQKITNDANYYWGLSLSADARTALVIQATLASNIWVMPAGDFARARQITNSNSGIGELCWTFDGRIVYSDIVSPYKADLWVTNPDGTGTRQLTFTDDRSEFQPSLSPDGRQLVFITKQAGLFSLWRMNVDGGGAKELVRNIDRNAGPQVSPDAQWVFYNTLDETGNSAYWKAPFEGGAPVKLREKVYCLLSPDGKWFACDYREPVPDAPEKLLVIPAAGGDPVHTLDLPRGLTKIHWSPGGQGFDFIAERDGIHNVWRLLLANGREQKLTDWQTQVSLYDFAWSRDNKHLAVTRDTPKSEIIFIQNFR